MTDSIDLTVKTGILDHGTVPTVYPAGKQGVYGLKREKERAAVHPLTPARSITISFAAVILIGTVLLLLPFSTREGQPPLSFLTALFTATSATCVTGLTLIDPYTQFTVFGQAILLLLIEIGGIGLLTFTSFFMLATGRKMGLRDLRLAQENTNASSLQNVRPLLKLIIATTVSIELVGALLLATRFVPRFGAEGIWISIFTSVSAYCNAGFDLLGGEAPFGSLIAYNGEPVVLFTVMALIVLGGLGFLVVQDLLQWRGHRRLLLHTRLVLSVTAALIAFGFFAFLITEYQNPKTLGPLPFGEKLAAALFQSVTARTCGFASIDIAGMQDLSKFLMICLMFVGAGSGSTGGGIKVSTFTVLIMTVVSVIRGRGDTVVMKHRVDKKTIYKSLTITFLGVCVIALSACVILLSMPYLSGIDGAFEAVSAFGTVGLTAGVTLELTTIAQLAVILTMFIGRVGPVSCALALTIRASQPAGSILPEGRIIVG